MRNAGLAIARTQAISKNPPLAKKIALRLRETMKPASANDSGLSTDMPSIKTLITRPSIPVRVLDADPVNLSVSHGNAIR